MSLWFNEIDSYAAQWLRNLWPPAKVDERSICNVSPSDVAGFQRAHFFAGVGGWEHALALAGWPTERPVWTGSCPCQPFSLAGRRKGTADARHLWPEFLRLITECQPSVIFGEQVAGAPGREWLAGVRADLEALGYEVGAADLCAACLGSPQIRQRIFWVAHLQGERFDGPTARAGGPRRPELEHAGDGVANNLGAGLEERTEQPAREECRNAQNGSGPSRLEHSPSNGRNQRRPESERRLASLRCWEDFRLIECADGKTRRIESRLQPLAHGVSNRVGKLRAYGNAIVPQVAAVFIRAFLERPSHAMKPTRQSAMSVVGFLVTIGLAVGIVCGLLWVGAKLLDKAKTISARHEAQLTNEMGDFRAVGGRAPDPVIERLLNMPEEVLVPSERMEFANDAEFFKWADSLKTWVILYRETLADPWTDSGNRLYGASNEVRAVLLDLCRWEGVWAGRGMTKDGRWRTQGFYRQVEGE